MYELKEENEGIEGIFKWNEGNSLKQITRFSFAEAAYPDKFCISIEQIPWSLK